MKKRLVGAATAAVLLASAAFIPATAVQPPKAEAPAQVPGSHRISFAGGKPVYSGPLEDQVTLPGILRQSPDVTVEDAWRLHVHNSLRRLGAPESVFPRDQRSHDSVDSFYDYEIINPGRDWDADGDLDLLSLRYTEGGTTYAALDGQTGQELWHWHTSSGDSYGEAATIGDGEGGVLLVSYGGVGAIAAGTVSARVIALGDDGEIRWETLYRGHLAYVPYAGMVARDVPTVTGIGQLTPSAATDAVVARETWTSTAVSGDARIATDVVDGATGAAAWSTRGEWSNDPAYPLPVADATGDGLDDIAGTGYETLSLVRGVDGAVAWTVDGLPIDYSPPYAVGDLTGDGRVDFAVSPFYYWYEQSLETVLLDGVTGARLGVVRGGFPTAAGDVDGDGKGDIGTIDLVDTEEFVRVMYGAYNGSGDLLRVTGYGVTPEWDTDAYAEFWPVGDVQKDGSADWAHSIVAVDNDGMVRNAERGVVSGRTGLRLWSGKAGHRARGAIDGEGEDLLSLGSGGVQAMDGTTGKVLWVRATPRDELDYAQAVGDLDGDGKSEVAAFMYGWSESGIAYRPWILSGADGRLLWGRGALVLQPAPAPTAAPL